MNIVTLTTWDVYNYGASLQAYALQTYLSQRGHNVRILDYQPEYLRRKYDYKWVNPESKLSKYALTRKLYQIMKFVQRQFTMRRKKAFDEFHKDYLVTTEKKYLTSYELMTTPPAADLYIVGSDQVWNTFYETGRDAMFYLSFVKYGAKASYAASFSFLDISEDNLKKIADYIKDFKGIAVRENDGVNILKKIGIDSSWVLDPVFLLSVDHWKSLIKPIEIDRPYLLVYDFENNKDIRNFCKKYAKQHGLIIVSINDTYPLIYADRNFNGAGPIEFLSLIYNCSAFVSNSFHGTAFSIMFNKPLFVFPRHRHAVNSRMSSLLGLFRLENCLIDIAVDNGIEDIDFSYVAQNDILVKERQKSITYLNGLLNE